MSNIGKVGIWLILSLLSAAAQAGTKYYYYTDPQGTVLAEADAQGNIIASYDYAPYGKQVLGTPPSGPAGYTGHVNDAESGLVYMQQRYYDPLIGRFLSVDPVTAYSDPVGSFNRYWYANSNPYRYTDPDGRAALWVKQSDGSVRLVIPVHFVGSGATHGNVMSIIMKDDFLNVGGAKVEINVVSTDKPMGGVLNTMDLSPGLDTKRYGSAGEGVNKLGGDTAHINSSAGQATGAAAHDVLHFAGIDDQYVEGPRDAQDNRTSKPKSGYNDSNIMTSRSGGSLKPQQLQEANRNSTTKHCTQTGGEESCI